MKDIPEYEGFYCATEDGRIFSTHSNRFLKPKNGTWYTQLKLCKDGYQAPIRVHTLIARTFIQNPNNYPEVNHKNGIKTDNRVENLEWCTRQNNIIHSYRILNRKRSEGATHPKSKLILDTQMGIFYDSIAFAARAKEIDRDALKYRIRRNGIYQGLIYA